MRPRAPGQGKGHTSRTNKLLLVGVVVVVAAIAVLAAQRYLADQSQDIIGEINQAATGRSPSPRPETVSQECVATLQPLVVALEELDGRLDVGLTKVQYGERVGDVSVAYSRLDVAQLAGMGLACVATAALLEDAFNEYVQANNKWSDCFARTGCTTDSIESQLQAHWSTACGKIVEARRAFPSQ